MAFQNLNVRMYTIGGESNQLSESSIQFKHNEIGKLVWTTYVDGATRIVQKGANLVNVTPSSMPSWSGVMSVSYQLAEGIAVIHCV